MKCSALCLLTLLLLGGCARQGPNTATNYDPVFGVRTDIMADNPLETPGEPREIIWLHASRMVNRQDVATYYLEVKYMAKADAGWLEIPPGENLILTIDGEPVKFRGSGSENMRARYKKDFVKERAIYQVPKATLQKIAKAKEVKVTIRGNNGLIQRTFDAANFGKFREFVEKFAES